MMIAAALQRAAVSLADACDSPRLDAELLLGRVVGLSRAALIARGGEWLDPAQQRAYDALLARRRAGEPVAYLTGRREFWSLDLAVTPDVLVPRPETEVLVEQALALLTDGPRRVLDLGTGSGAIALALAAERPRARIVAVDVSAGALAVARANGAALGIAGIDWRLGSWFEAVPGERFDLIAANPPYVAAGDPALSRLAAEPELALVGGPTGLEALAHIVAHAPAHLEAGGWLVLEHGSTQAGDVARLLEQHGFQTVRPQADLAGHARVTLGARPAATPRFTVITRGHAMILFETTLGNFTIEFFEKEAPISVANFKKYVDGKFFDGTIFHRIVPGFVIQGGGFTEDMSQKKTQPPIKNEADNGLKNSRGTLSMARTNDINSATSQFFVNLKDNDFLDHSRGNFGYAVFARVTEGMDVIDKIAAVETGRKKGFDDVPVDPVIMTSVHVVAS